MAQTSNYLDIKELSCYLKIKEKTLYCWVERSEIPYYRIGKLIRFRQGEIDTWMESKKAKSVKQSVDKIIHSVYTPGIGRSDRLKRKEA